LMQYCERIETTSTTSPVSASVPYSTTERHGMPD
jgi:hypothetical protein